MAILFRHGPNGSYKSAIIVWFHIIEGLKEGRIVITNMEGMYPLEKIQESLAIKFPDSARLIRIGSLKKSKKELWQNWFSWVPLGALIVIDEVQSIYNKSFKGGLLLRPFEDFEEELPSYVKELFDKQKALIKANEFDEGDTDDTGDLRFNDDGTIIRPDTLEDSFERHRKYNWDIVFGTPDITQIATNVRACAETAFSHRSRDSFIFTRRRPRIFEHNPKSNGITTKKQDCTSMYVPVKVHLCYKSTQTNTFTKSGEGSNPLKSPALLAVLGVVLVSLSFFFVALYDVLSREDNPINQQNETTIEALHSDVEPVKKPNSMDLKTPKTNSIDSIPNNKSADDKSDGILMRVALLANASTGNQFINDLILPYNAKSIYLTGYAHPAIYIFELTFEPEDGLETTIQLNSDDLKSIGWFVRFVDDGLVAIKNNLTDITIFCVFNQRAKREVIEDNEPNIFNNSQDEVSEQTDFLSAFTLTDTE